MSHVVRISNTLFKRLESHAEGFDTPANVIERLLNTCEANGLEPSTQVESTTREATNLEISYSGLSEEQFKRQLLEKKYCYVTRHFTNGSKNTKYWNASKFTRDSNVMQNLRSGYLRGWRHEGVFKAELSFSEPDYS